MISWKRQVSIADDTFVQGFIPLNLVTSKMESVNNICFTGLTQQMLSSSLYH